MNGRQAAKLAAKQIEELEHYNARCKADITAYNHIITGLIAGNLNPCEWCEENNECTLNEKGKGCSEWWLGFTHPTVEEVETDDREGVSIEGTEGRTGTKAD